MSNARLALTAATNPPDAVVIDAVGTGTAAIELAELPEGLAPSIAILQGPGEHTYADAVAIEETAIPIPESAPRWAHDGAAFSEDQVSGAAWGERPGAGYGRGRKGPVTGSPRAGRRRRVALVAGGLLATFALGWIGGTISTRLLSPAPAASPLKQRLEASTRSASRPRADATAGPTVHKLSSAPIATRPEPAAVALESGAKDLSHPLPVPETRPVTIDGWTVRDVSGGVASLAGPQGTWRAARGDMVPGLGRVDSIVRWGNYWLVSTSRGLVASE